jgi:hypothetical protein
VILECFKQIIVNAERISVRDPRAALELLRSLPLDDFGLLLLSMPSDEYPSLSRLLPQMADPQVQRDWTGADGVVLLTQSLNFVRTMSQGYTEIVGSSLRQKRILDFGVGWGRLVRLMYHYCDPENIFGCDPWDASLDVCRRDGLRCNLAQSDWLPNSLPFSGKFDLIFAFSVFTHLSERATAQALQTLASQISDDGLLVITIRPVEYWHHHQPMEDRVRQDLVACHRSIGFAFAPHNRQRVDGDVTYGDTSIALDWLQKRIPALRIRRVDHSLVDPYQIIVMLSN